MLPVETHAYIDQFTDCFCEAQHAFGVDCAFYLGHFARVHRGECAGDGFFIGEKLVKSSRRCARLLGDRVCGGLVVTKTAEDCGSGAEEILLALLATRVALAVWIEDGHRKILAERKHVSKNLHPSSNASIYLHRR